MSVFNTLHEALIGHGDNDSECFADPSLTRGQLRFLIKRLAARLKAQEQEVIAVYCEDSAFFCLAICAALYACKTPYLLQAHLLGQLKGSGMFLLSDSAEACAQYAGLDLSDFAQDTLRLPLEEDFDLPSPHGEIVLCTSGSTGRPKEVRKSLECMELEAMEMYKLIGAELAGLKLCASVYSGHLYGLTFGMFLPLLSATPIRRHRVTQAGELCAIDEDTAFVTSPAFMKHLDYRLVAPKIRFAISASGLLDTKTAADFIRWSGCDIHEIYGSTETGVMATRVWRKNASGLRMPPERPFKLLDMVSIVRELDGYCYVRSPLCSKPKLRIEDDLGFVSHDSFMFRGRKGRTVKIEDLLVNLDMVEKLLLKFSEISDCAALVVDGDNRSELALAVVLKEHQGTAFGGTADKGKLLESLRRYLTPYLPQICLPSRLKCLTSLPRDIQGKLHVTELFAAFRDDPHPLAAGATVAVRA